MRALWRREENETLQVGAVPPHCAFNHLPHRLNLMSAIPSDLTSTNQIDCDSKREAVEGFCWARYTVGKVRTF